MTDTTITPKGRVCFPELFEPKNSPQGGDEFYSCTLLLEKEDITNEMKSLVVEACKQKWGGKTPDKIHGFQSPFKNGNDKDPDKYPAFQDKIFISAKSKFQPGVVDHRKQEILATEQVYGGCYGRLMISAYGWEYMGKKGVSFNLLHFQKLGEGEAFGKRIKVTEAFDAVDIEEESSEGVTADGDNFEGLM